MYNISAMLNMNIKFFKNFWQIIVNLNPKKQYGQLISSYSQPITKHLITL